MAVEIGVDMSRLLENRQGQGKLAEQSTGRDMALAHKASTEGEQWLFSASGCQGYVHS